VYTDIDVKYLVMSVMQNHPFISTMQKRSQNRLVYWVMAG